jgi:hypothetical protein
MEGMDRWTIVDGPARLKAGRRATFTLVREIVVDTGKFSRLRTTAVIYDVQPIADAKPMTDSRLRRLLGRGTEPMVAFLTGRLFGSGEVSVGWGTYDPATKRGDFWLLAVPRPYTGYYAGDVERLGGRRRVA